MVNGISPAALRARTRQSLTLFNQQQRQIQNLARQAQEKQQRLQAQQQAQKTPTVQVSQVSREALATAKAFEFIEKKARGERINLAQQPNDVQREFERLSNQPNIRRVLDTTSEIKSLAIESGFGQDVQEFLQAQGFAGKPSVKPPKEEQRFDVFGIPIPKTPLSKLFPKGFTKAELEKRRGEFKAPDITPVIGTKITREQIQELKDFKPPIRSKIENFIRRNIPGGATIVRKLRSGEETLKDIEKDFPALEDFVSEEERERRRKLEEEGLVVERAKDFPEFPGGTRVDIEKLREATFEEKLGIKENKDSTKLKLQAELIQEQFILGKISEEQANERLDNKLTNFVFTQTKKGLPQTIALSVGLVALQGIPILGQVVGAGLLTSAILQRRKILSFTKRFPRASALSLSGVLVGGLAGSVIKGQISSRINNNINPASLKSITLIKGKGRTKLIRQAQQVNPELRVGLKNQKISGVTTYEILLKDGRKFKVVEFSKLSAKDLAKGLKGEKSFIGLQVDIAKGERFFGKGVTTIVDGKAETFLRVLRFKPANTPLSRALQRFGFNKGKAVNILEKSRVVIRKGKITRVVSEARILSIKSVNRNLGRKISDLERNLAKGQKVNVNQLKSLINLERRSQGLKPFTELEFRQAGTPVVTNTLIREAINRAKVSFTKNEKLIRLSADIKTGSIGFAGTKPGEAFKVGVTKAEIVKTPFSKTFGKKPLTLSDFSQQIAKLFKESKTASKQRLISISKQIRNLKSRVTGSPGSLTLALANRLESPRFVPGAVPFVSVPSIFRFGASASIFSGSRSLSREETVILTKIDPQGKILPIQRALISNADRLDTRLNILLRNITLLKSQLKTKQELKVNTKSITLTRTLIATRTNQLQNLKQVQKLAQKLKQKQKVIFRRAVGVAPKIVPTPPAKPFVPIIQLVDEEGKPKKRIIKKEPITRVKKKGFNAFAKKTKSKDFKKLNIVPLTRKQALSLAALTIDKTISATGRIGRTKKPAQKPKLRFDKNYFQKNIKKFRQFKIRKGKEIKTPFQIIERRKFRLDDPKEKQTIKSFRKRLIKKSKLKSTSKMEKKRKKVKRR